MFLFTVLSIVKKYKDIICKSETKSRIADDGSNMIGFPHFYAEILLL